MKKIIAKDYRPRFFSQVCLFATMVLLMFLMVGWPVTANCADLMQDGKVQRSGIVKDVQGNAIGGATVIIAGTSIGTTTNEKGEFIIEAAPSDALMINFIGYLPQNISVGSQNHFDIVLEESTTSIDEVMVVGYGVRKKTTLTGSVVLVKGDEIAKSPAIDVTAALAGRLPGLIVNTRAGDPGAPDTQVLVRGRGTTGDNSALIIIDGVERGDISKLNPNDIESVNVLKDAEAAIYGSRAANGVILITTKRGAKGSAVVNFSFDQGFQQPTRTPKMADSYTFANVANDMAILRHSDPNSAPVLPYSPEDLAKFKAGKEAGYRSVNWFDETAHSWTPQHRANISVSGGTERVNYYFSLGELMQRDRFKESSGKYRQYNFRSNIDARIAKSLTVGMNLSGMYDDRHVPYFSSTEMASHLFLYHPYWETYWPGTKYLKPLRGDQNWVNMVSDNAGYHDLNNTKFQGTLFLKWEVPWVKGLMLEASGSYDMTHQHWKTFRTPSYIYKQDGEDGYVKQLDGMGPSKAQLTDRSQMSDQLYFFAKIAYTKSFGDHNLDALLGYEQTTTDGWYLEGSKTDFASPSLPILNVGPADKTKWGLGGYSSENARQNVFARVNYDYRGKYMAQVTMRIDGSAIFPESDRFGYFPSVSAGWRISEENFMKSAEFYKAIGIFKDQAEVDSYPHLSGTQPGDLKFEDVNGDNVLDSKDRILVKQTKIPEITFGLNFTFNYKNFDLSLLFQGQHNSKFYMEGNESFFKFMDDQWGNFLQWRADGRWVPGADNSHATQPRGGQNSVNTADRNTHFMFSGNFLRFKNAELGYSLPSKIAEKLRMGGIRITLSANNICFLYDGLKDLGYDGEASSFWQYSVSRTINIGINLTF